MNKFLKIPSKCAKHLLCFTEGELTICGFEAGEFWVETWEDVHGHVVSLLCEGQIVVVVAHLLSDQQCFGEHLVRLRSEDVWCITEY